MLPMPQPVQRQPARPSHPPFPPQERLEAISEELRHMSERAEEVRTSLTSGSGDVSALTSQMDALQTRHAQLTLEQNELLKAQRK